MKRIAVGITQSEKEVSPNMELCEYYYLVDYKNHNVENILKVRNPYKTNANKSLIATFIKDQKTNTIVTGTLPAELIKSLKEKNIEVIDNKFGEVKNIISEIVNHN